jgi:hypothetical protein
MNSKRKKTNKKKTPKKTTKKKVKKKVEKTEKIMRIALKASNQEILGKLVREFRLDTWGAGGTRRLPDGSGQTEADVQEKLLPKLRKAGSTIKVIEDATKVGKARQKEVGRGDRFKGGKIAPRGLGRKE